MSCAHCNGPIDEHGICFECDKRPECIRCGTVLDSDEGIETGICADCWTDKDNFEGETL